MLGPGKEKSQFKKGKQGKAHDLLPGPDPHAVRKAVDSEGPEQAEEPGSRQAPGGELAESGGRKQESQSGYERHTVWECKAHTNLRLDHT